MNIKSILNTRLSTASGWIFNCYAGLAAFLTYFCMYSFRKPFSAAKYSDLTVGFLSNVSIGSLDLSVINLKTAFVISQIIGYTISKFIGIKVCSEISWSKRAKMLIGLVLAAEVSLVFFGLLPNDFKILAIFLNGLPLGMVWGLVVGYLEGRRSSELLLACLSCSFIVSSGVVKDVGRMVMNQWQVGEFWMPAVVGLVFMPLFLLSVWLLNQLPQPNKSDIDMRVKRIPMDHSKRFQFLRQFFPGLILLLICYFFLTAYRDFRDNYGIEILTQLGYEGQKGIFTKTELPVAFGVMACLAMLNLVQDRVKGLIVTFGLMLTGIILMAVSTVCLQINIINGLWWMIMIGFGAYITFVPFGSVLFDRMIASTKVAGNAVYAIYLADAIGYSGSVVVQLYKDLFTKDFSKLNFFINYTYFMSIVGGVCLTLGCVYFIHRVVKLRNTD